jgi:hypothetical protein
MASVKHNHSETAARQFARRMPRTRVSVAIARAMQSPSVVSMVWYDIPDIFCQDCVAIMRDLDCTAAEAAGESVVESLSYCKETRYPSSSICVLYGMICDASGSGFSRRFRLRERLTLYLKVICT